MCTEGDSRRSLPGDASLLFLRASVSPSIHPSFFCLLSFSFFSFVHFAFPLPDVSSLLSSRQNTSQAECVSVCVCTCVLCTSAPLQFLHHTGCLGVYECLCMCVLNNAFLFCQLCSLTQEIFQPHALSPSVVSILAFSQCALSSVGMNGLHIVVCVCMCVKVCVYLAGVSVFVRETMKVENQLISNHRNCTRQGFLMWTYTCRYQNCRQDSLNRVQCARTRTVKF